MRRLYFFIIILLVIILPLCCDLDTDSNSKKDNTDSYNLNDLPPDNGGLHISYELNATSEYNYGHYVYIPDGYDSTELEYPLLVALHGSGECGNGSLPDLDRVLVHGPASIINDYLNSNNNAVWNPKFPMIVVSPQTSINITQREKSWVPEQVHEFITYLTEHYRIREDRIYITGLSMGAYGTYAYLAQYGNNSHAAAAVAICGGGQPYDTNGNNNSENAEQFAISNAESLRNIPLWAFHGSEDPTVPFRQSVDMVRAINNLVPSPAVRAKITIYEDVNHNSWKRTYDGSGINATQLDGINVNNNDGTFYYSYNCDNFDIDIYSWMFQYKR